ncbi:MAG: NADH-quinone oxidoreductase subunit L [Trueperaceae bacterium]|nr:NADH-quinone oxidoreductase subunit L [Trueperaceae bacterium]
MSALVSVAALAPFVALLGAVINGAFGRQLKEPLPGIIGSVAVGIGFALSLLAFLALLFSDVTSVSVPLWSYLEAGGLELELGFVIDHLSVLMMLIITGVGLLIHIYSVGYMHGDPGFSRYFMGLNLFVAAMLLLVMGDSFVLIFLGWEGVGVCSYLLIGFWYRERLNADAARKAFIVNRIGDVGFLLAMFLTFKTFGTLDIAAVNEAAGELVFGSAVLGVIGLLYLLAACGKSAQLPLQVWLPDAMAGPTPVSALIHAATMVTAGVYLIARAAPLFAQTPAASEIVAWVGALTAIVAAVSALAQTDIKKVLAYSTVSQLGYMFVAVGVGAYWAGIFHLFTHAFFKALLFLNAGSVIHALGGEQDMNKMGGLGKKMKITGRTSLIATLAIAGVPFLAGFFSKDAILASSLNSELIGSGVGLYLVLLFTAVLTAFYMFRWYYRVFAGAPRLDKKVAAKVHESPTVMTRPLVILAGFSVFAGYLGLPEFAFPNWIAHWLEPALETSVSFRHPSAATEWLLIFVSIAAVALGLGLGYYVYHLKGGALAKRYGSTAPARLARQGLGFDALYRAVFVRPGEGTASGLAVLDKDLVDRGITGSFTTVGLLAQFTGRLQTGFVRSYALLMLAGLVLLVIAVVLFGGLS